MNVKVWVKKLHNVSTNIHRTRYHTSIYFTIMERGKQELSIYMNNIPLEFSFWKI